MTRYAYYFLKLQKKLIIMKGLEGMQDPWRQNRRNRAFYVGQSVEGLITELCFLHT